MGLFLGFVCVCFFLFLGFGSDAVAGVMLSYFDGCAGIVFDV